MARTVNPALHAERRLAIIDAALTCFARDGYAGATTAAICREAGIGSGTFFHYFPTKRAAMEAILDLDHGEQTDWFARQAGRHDPVSVIDEYVEHTGAVLQEPRLAGFVVAVAAVMTEPEIRTALARTDRYVRTALAEWLTLAQDQGLIRADLPAIRLASWVMVLINGFIDELVTDVDFDAVAESGVLRDGVRRLLGVQPG